MITLAEIAAQLNVTEAYVAEVVGTLGATVWPDGLTTLTAAWVSNVIAKGGPKVQAPRTFPADGSDLYADRRADQENRMARGEQA